MAPDGSPYTSCDRAVEKAREEGRLITLRDEISPGEFKTRQFIIYPNDKHQSES